MEYDLKTTKDRMFKDYHWTIGFEIIVFVVMALVTIYLTNGF